MELLLCSCRRKCVRGECPCIDNALLCTNACNLNDCDSMQTAIDEEEEFSYESDNSQSDDEDNDD